MALKRSDLESLLQGVENKDDIINKIMAEHGKSINELKAENETLKAENETLKGQVLDKTNEYNALVEKTKDYDSMKQSNEELNKTISSFKAKEENQKYYSVLKELGYNEEFIDETIFNKVQKGENIETFKANATEFLKAKPMYRGESFQKQGGSYGGFANITDDMSDAELEAALKEMNKK